MSFTPLPRSSPVAGFRLPLLTCVAVVAREKATLQRLPHAAELVSDFLDHSPHWSVAKAAPCGYLHLLHRLAMRNSDEPVDAYKFETALQHAIRHEMRPFDDGMATFAKFLLLHERWSDTE